MADVGALKQIMVTVNPSIVIHASAYSLEAESWRLKTPNSISFIKAADYPTLAVRPAFCVLSCSKIESILKITPSDWRARIKCVLEKLSNHTFDQQPLVCIPYEFQ